MTANPAQVNQAQLDVLGITRAISAGHRDQAAAVLDNLRCAEKDLMLTGAVVLLAHVLDAYAHTPPT